MQAAQSTFATARVNRLIGKVFAAAALLLSIESSLNFFGQLKYLNGLIAYPVIIGLWITTILFASSYWFGSAREIYLRIHALYMFIPVALWPIMLSQLPPSGTGFYPWLWWAVDTGWIAAALSLRLRWTVLYFLVLNIAIQYIFSKPMGGSHHISVVAADFTYTLLTNGTIAVIALLLRSAAEQTDIANAEAIQSRVKQAQADASSREQQRLDALVHDRVLTALISAANATDEVQAEAAADLARSAINKLREVEDSDNTGYVLTTDTLDALVLSAKEVDPQLEVKLTDQARWLLEQQVAYALTEATLQAVQNSVLHAGPKAKRELFLKVTDQDLKIVIRDDGKGFRPNRISKGRLGIRLSIVGRVESVGGQVKISSNPGAGTTIVLEWSRA